MPSERAKVWGWRALLWAVVVLSVATGLTKLIRMPEEMALFSNAGFPDTLTIAFGGLQVLGGIAMIFAGRWRVAGALVMACTFAIATLVLFANQMTTFGIVSVAFIVAAAYFVRRPAAPYSNSR